MLEVVDFIFGPSCANPTAYCQGGGPVTGLGAPPDPGDAGQQQDPRLHQEEGGQALAAGQDHALLEYFDLMPPISAFDIF